MGRVTITTPASTGVPKKETAREKRIRQSTEAVKAAEPTPARRGEDDDLDEELAKAAAAAASAPAEQLTHVPSQDVVTLAREEVNPFQFIEPPEDADVLEQMGMVRRGISRANRGLANGLGAMQKGYVQSAGEYLWWATQGDRLKKAGFKSVEKFAEPLDLTKQDIYRLRRAVPIYRLIGDLVEEALNERTIRELYQTLTNDKGDLEITDERSQNLREQYTLMKEMGRVNSGGAAAASRIMMLGAEAPSIEGDGAPDRSPSVVDQLAKAHRNRRFVDLGVLREAKKTDPEAAKRYVDDLRRLYEAAAEIVQGGEVASSSSVAGAIE